MHPICSGFEIAFISKSLLFIEERNGRFDIPWCIFWRCGVHARRYALPSVLANQALRLCSDACRWRRHGECRRSGTSPWRYMRDRGQNQYKNGFFTSLSILLTVCLLHRGCARFRTFVLQRGSLPFLFRFRQRSFGAMACHAIKKLAWQPQKVCQAEVFSPKKRRLELMRHQFGKIEPGIRFFRFSYVHAKKRWNHIIIYWKKTFYEICFAIQGPVASLVRGHGK